MGIRSTLFLFLIASGGCTVDTTAPELPANHPAHSGAPEAPYVPPKNVLAADPAEAAPPGPARPSQGETPPVKKIDSLPEETKKALTEILQTYEKIRSLLASDKVEGIAEAAEAISTRASKLSPSAPEPLRPDLNGLAKAADQLKHAEHVGLEGARKAFGDLSRSAVRIVAAVPALTENRKVFQCPMWKKGYAKWIQTDPKVANPYQGPEMLDCGGPSEWKE